MMRSDRPWVFLGLTLTSSWGNGHATTYRGLVRALSERGHDIVFLERDMPWYAAHRDPVPIEGVSLEIYSSVAGLEQYRELIERAPVVIVGSYVPDGREVGERVLSWARGVRAFYDIDTPITLSALDDDRCEYLAADQLPRYDLYLSFTGGPAVSRLEKLGVQFVRPLYCAVDPSVHRPTATKPRWDLGYLGTYAEDRQPRLETLLLDVAREAPGKKFVVAGPLYPSDTIWPGNVDRLEHVAPDWHGRFYCQQRFTLNLTRDDMRRLGYAPSVRLFEAAACGTTIITDIWDGLEYFFEPWREIIPVYSSSGVDTVLTTLSDRARREIGERARKRVLAFHTARHRAEALEQYVDEVRGRTPKARRPGRQAVAS